LLFGKGAEIRRELVTNDYILNISIACVIFGYEEK
jgi:hypothetical protein